MRARIKIDSTVSDTPFLQYKVNDSIYQYLWYIINCITDIWTKIEKNKRQNLTYDTYSKLFINIIIDFSSIYPFKFVKNSNGSVSLTLWNKPSERKWLDWISFKIIKQLYYTNFSKYTDFKINKSCTLQILELTTAWVSPKQVVLM